MPSNPGPKVERKMRPMFSRCKIARTPGIFSAAAVSSLSSRPLAIVASTGTAYSMPGKWKSAVYCASPLTLTGPSTRGVSRPTGDMAGVSWVLIGTPSVASARRSHMQGVRKAPCGQFDFKRVLALWFRVAHRSLRRLAKVGGVGVLADERGLRLWRSPWFGAHAAKGNASLRHLPASYGQDDGR